MDTESNRVTKTTRRSFLKRGMKALALVAAQPLVKGAKVEAAAQDGVDGGLRMNQVQVIGSHNSYHLPPKGPQFTRLKEASPEAASWDYAHAPLDVQLDRGVRSFELDVYHDPAGTKVLHVPQYDPESTCSEFAACLETVRNWSEKNPNHVPLIFLVELKDDKIPQTQFPILRFDAAALDQLDREIHAVFGPERLLVPDDVRGDAPTLSQALREYGWPLLETVRGKVMLVLHARGLHAELYTENRPSLEGRSMFLESQEGKPYASVFIRNNPRDDSIPRLVREGYLVRTRADSSLREGASGDTARREAALASGAHIVSTDFPPGEAHPRTGYVVAFPEERPARCNPVNAPAGCETVEIETPQRSPR